VYLCRASCRDERISRWRCAAASVLAVIFWLLTAGAIAQETAPASTPAANQPQDAQPSAATSSTQAASSAQAPANSGSELTSRDEVTTFKVKVNLVLVHVVVRDGKGNPVGGLHQEDFAVLDNGKPQIVSQFSAEGPGVKPAAHAAEGAPAAPSGESPKVPVIPNHFVAYLFDDVHASWPDLMLLRDAAIRHLDTLLPTDRAAIFTTSGQGNLDFTDDHELLKKALNKLRPNAVARDTGQQCPDISAFQADLITNKSDTGALVVATDDALSCQFNNDTRFIAQAQQLAQATSTRVVMENEHEARLNLSVVQDVLRRIAIMPGQRTILLLSPGFLTSGLVDIYVSLIDQALRSQVVISAMNSRGLYTVDPIGDVTKTNPPNQTIAIEKLRYTDLSNIEQETVLRDLSDGTGGSYYHNSNDLYAGFQRIASTPEFYYVLGFAPQNLKLDGRFHGIKVVVKNPPKLSVQARRGYYAPRHAANPNEEAKQEIEDALFSQEELHDLPVDLHTQFFKASETDAQLAVLVHIDARHLHYNRDQGRNANQLTIVSGLFDRNGKFITANEKVLEMHLKDDTLANKLDRGFTLKSNFDVKPGAYVVRLVVRDAGGQISAANGAIEIP